MATFMVSTARTIPPALSSGLSHPLDKFVFYQMPAQVNPSPGPVLAAGSAPSFGFAGAVGPFDSAGSFVFFGSAGLVGPPGAAGFPGSPGSAGLPGSAGSALPVGTRRSFADLDIDDKPQLLFDVGFYSWYKGYTWVERLCCPPTACKI